MVFHLDPNLIVILSLLNVRFMNATVALPGNEMVYSYQQVDIIVLEIQETSQP